MLVAAAQLAVEDWTHGIFKDPDFMGQTSRRGLEMIAHVIQRGPHTVRLGLAKDIDPIVLNSIENNAALNPPIVLPPRILALQVTTE